MTANDAALAKRPPDPDLETKRLSVLIVDDHPMVGDALKWVLESLLHDASLDYVEHLDALVLPEGRAPSAARRPDLVLLDLGLPGCTGTEALTRARAIWPDVPVIVFSASDRADTIRAALRAGAAGFIPKTSAHRLLVDAIRLVLNGGIYIPPNALDGVLTGAGLARGGPIDAPRRNLEPENDPDEGAGGDGDPDALHVAEGVPGDPAMALSLRQRQVFALLAEGLSNKQICRQLSISENTVKTHVAAVLRTVGANSRRDVLLMQLRRR